MTGFWKLGAKVLKCHLSVCWLPYHPLADTMFNHNRSMVQGSIFVHTVHLGYVFSARPKTAILPNLCVRPNPKFGAKLAITWGNEHFWRRLLVFNPFFALNPRIWLSKASVTFLIKLATSVARGGAELWTPGPDRSSALYMRKVQSKLLKHRFGIMPRVALGRADNLSIYR